MVKKGRLAANLKKVFRAKAGERKVQHMNDDDDLKIDNVENKDGLEEEVEERTTEYESMEVAALSEEITDEFFDAFGPSDYHLLEDGWPSHYFTTTHLYSHQSTPGDTEHLTTAVLSRKLDDDVAADQKKGNVDIYETATKEESLHCKYGYTLPNDPSSKMESSWTTADPSTFLIRGNTYLHDHKKIKAQGTLMQMVAADWLKSDKREDDLAGRPGSIVQKYAARNGQEFFIIVNFQFPGVTTHNLAFYYMLSTPVEDVPLLDKFIKGDDAYRNSRFKLIPSVFQGPWIIKQVVTKKPSLVGQALKVNYFQGKNYLELGIDIGSSNLARHVAGLVLSYMNNLVGELAFLIQGNTSEDLPEVLLGTCRINHLDVSKAIPVV